MPEETIEATMNSAMLTPARKRADSVTEDEALLNTAATSTLEESNETGTESDLLEDTSLECSPFSFNCWNILRDRAWASAYLDEVIDACFVAKQIPLDVTEEITRVLRITPRRLYEFETLLREAPPDVQSKLLAWKENSSARVVLFRQLVSLFPPGGPLEVLAQPCSFSTQLLAWQLLGSVARYTRMTGAATQPNGTETRRTPSSDDGGVVTHNGLRGRNIVVYPLTESGIPPTPTHLPDRSTKHPTEPVLKIVKTDSAHLNMIWLG